MYRSKVRFKNIRQISAMTALCLFFLAVSAHAEDRNDSFSLALGLGWSSSHGFEVDVAGLRWGRELGPRWGFEVTALTDDVDDVDLSNRFLDLSATYVLWRNEDSRLLLFGGAGVLFFDDFRRYYVPGEDYAYVIADFGTGEAATLHFGIAWEKDVFERSFLRTDFRHRYHDSRTSFADDLSADATFSFGWRF